MEATLPTAIRATCSPLAVILRCCAWLATRLSRRSMTTCAARLSAGGGLQSSRFLQQRIAARRYPRRQGLQGRVRPGHLAGQGDPAMDVTDAIASARFLVRRLTPTECERLQGFPDGWTRIPYRGRLPDECPDGPRYKALGNSMCVPCMRWIGERIQMVDAVLCDDISESGNARYQRESNGIMTEP